MKRFLRFVPILLIIPSAMLTVGCGLMGCGKEEPESPAKALITSRMKALADEEVSIKKAAQANEARAVEIEKEIQDLKSAKDALSRK